jgi:anti-sigma28 factor (negative regulator of flagellin synthesis)
VKRSLQKFLNDIRIFPMIKYEGHGIVSFSAVNINHGGEAKMISKLYRSALMLVALGVFVAAPIVNAQPSPASNVLEAINEAKQAVEHGKAGHAEALVTHSEKSLNYAERGGKDSHLKEAIKKLKEAIEHGKAGHADVATEHADSALTHLNAIKF